MKETEKAWIRRIADHGELWYGIGVRPWYAASEVHIWSSRPDAGAITGLGHTVAVEFKTSIGRSPRSGVRSFRQAFVYRSFADACVLVVRDQPPRCCVGIGECERHGIGVLHYDPPQRPHLLVAPRWCAPDPALADEFRQRVRSKFAAPGNPWRSQCAAMCHSSEFQPYPQDEAGRVGTLWQGRELYAEFALADAQVKMPPADMVTPPGLDARVWRLTLVDFALTCAHMARLGESVPSAPWVEGAA